MLNSRQAQFLFCSIVGLSVTSCGSNGCRVTSIEQTISDTATVFQLLRDSKIAELQVNISPVGHSPVQFYLTPQEIDFKNYQTLVAGIVNPSMTDRQKAFYLWRFTAEWCAGGIPPARNREPCDPLKLFNSIEFALCGGINSALSNLYSLAGLRSRVYHLSGHVVAEVYYDSVWHMFDADRNIYFMNDKGDVADVKYISEHPEIIKAQRDKIRNWAGLKLSYKMIQRVYSTRQNNAVNDWFKDIPFNYDNRIVLAKGDEIDFRISETNTQQRFRKYVTAHAHLLYTRQGNLKRKMATANTYQVKNEFVFKEELPYLITSVSIHTKGISLPAQTNVWVYYSPDSVRWYFKGILSHASAKIYFNSTNKDNELSAFSYYLKLVSSSSEVDIKDLSFITIENSFLFSGKIFMNDRNSFKLVLLNNAINDSLNIKISERGIPQ